MEEKEAENVKVAVRCRPMNAREIQYQSLSCFKRCNDGTAVLTNLDNPNEEYFFGFDYVYGCDSPQSVVFQDIGIPLLDRAFSGYNGTIFAYGQTGSGKTFSMTGVSGSSELEGLIPRINKAIFERIQKDQETKSHLKYLVECSFFEIYNEIIYDLLSTNRSNSHQSASKQNKAGLEIKEHSVLGIYVKDLQERVVTNHAEVIDLMTTGNLARTVGSTYMNAESSRSHSIFVIKIHQKDTTDESKNIFAKINLVDLAGSERATSTGAQGDRLKEGANINKSLSALGNVINALVEAARKKQKIFIPYRNSKLTRVLQESLGGNSLCTMLATLSPANINFIETLSTLKYATRAKSITVSAKKNDASSQISKLNDEIAALKQKLQEQTEAASGLDVAEKNEIISKYEKQIQEMDRIRLQTWEDKARLSKQHEVERRKLAKERAAADQKIREERNRKWLLLQDKGDYVLMIRALQDLYQSEITTSNKSENDHDGIDDAKWIILAQQLKEMEIEIKDHRILITVFKDSLDKDVTEWSQRYLSPQVSGNNISDQDYAVALHTVSSQVTNKLQQISQECNALCSAEDAICESSKILIHQMTKALSSLIGTPNDDIKNSEADNSESTQKIKVSGKGDVSIVQEREKGLRMAIDMIQNFRDNTIKVITNERKKLFSFPYVAKEFMRYLDTQLSSCKNTKSAKLKENAEVVIKKWSDLKVDIQTTQKTWERMWSEESHSSSSVKSTATSSEKPQPLGLQSKAVPDESIKVSSNTQLSTFIRMDSKEYWQPHASDKLPTIVVDFCTEKLFHSIHIRGGNLMLHGTGNAVRPKSSKRISAVPFVFKEKKYLQTIIEKYEDTNLLTGDHETTYSILSNVMNWSDLFKDGIVPSKIFDRPPLRFIHDVVSVILRNSQYAPALFTQEEMDYNNLSSKELRGQYLSKLLKYVQDDFNSYSSKNGSKAIVISATAGNIQAGKEPSDTLIFFCLFALAAIRSYITCPAQDPCDGQNSTSDLASQPENPESHTIQSCWVEKITVSTSNDGSNWNQIGDYVGNTDAKTIKTLNLPQNTSGRYLQLACIESNNAPIIQIEVYGDQILVQDGASSNKNSSYEIKQYMESILSVAAVLRDESMTLLESIKLDEVSKKQEMDNITQEINILKQERKIQQGRLTELEAANVELSQQLSLESTVLQSERTKNEALNDVIAAKTKTISELKHQVEQLELNISKTSHQIQKLTIQESEQSKVLSSITKSKQDLEALCSQLRTELQDLKQQETKRTDNVVLDASLKASTIELHAVQLQLRELQRELDTSNELRSEQQKVCEDLQKKVQQQQKLIQTKENEFYAIIKEQESSKLVHVGKLEEELEALKHRLQSQLRDNQALQTAKRELERHEMDLRVQLQNAKTNEAVALQSLNTTIQEKNAEMMSLEIQTQELRRQAEIDKLETKIQNSERHRKEIQEKLATLEGERRGLSHRIQELENTEEELQTALQIVTEERDSSRQKEEQWFAEVNEKDQEIERIRDGYVWVTDRMNAKEDELADLQEQIEKYQSILQITSPTSPTQLSSILPELYALAIGSENNIHDLSQHLMAKELKNWIQNVKCVESNSSIEKNELGEQKVNKNSDSVSQPSSTSRLTDETVVYEDEYDFE